MPFEELYKENYSIVYGFLFNLCKNESMTEELTASTFFKAFSKFTSFNGKCKISTWLCQIAENEYFQYCRKHKRLNGLNELHDIPDDTYIEETIQDKATAIEIHKLLHNLEEPYKEVFILRVFAELNFKEIATVIGKTETWARVTYHRARKKLQEQMEDRNV